MKKKVYCKRWQTWLTPAEDQETTSEFYSDDSPFWWKGQKEDGEVRSPTREDFVITELANCYFALEAPDCSTRMAAQARVGKMIEKLGYGVLLEKEESNDGQQ
jgi:hypothetical protein